MSDETIHGAIKILLMQHRVLRSPPDLVATKVLEAVYGAMETGATEAEARKPALYIGRSLARGFQLGANLDYEDLAQAIAAAIEADRTASGLVSVEDVARWLVMMGQDGLANRIRGFGGSWLTDLARLDREGR